MLVSAITSLSGGARCTTAGFIGIKSVSFVGVNNQPKEGRVRRSVICGPGDRGGREWTPDFEAPLSDTLENLSHGASSEGKRPSFCDCDEIRFLPGSNERL